MCSCIDTQVYRESVTETLLSQIRVTWRDGRDRVTRSLQVKMAHYVWTANNRKQIEANGILVNLVGRYLTRIEGSCAFTPYNGNACKIALALCHILDTSPSFCEKLSQTQVSLSLAQVSQACMFFLRMLPQHSHCSTLSILFGCEGEKNKGFDEHNIFSEGGRGARGNYCFWHWRPNKGVNPRKNTTWPRDSTNSRLRNWEQSSAPIKKSPQQAAAVPLNLNLCLPESLQGGATWKHLPLGRLTHHPWAGNTNTCARAHTRTHWNETRRVLLSNEDCEPTDRAAGLWEI